MDDSKEQRAENGEFNGKIAETAGEGERGREADTPSRVPYAAGHWHKFWLS